MAWVGFKLVAGQSAVALGALEAGRLSEALMQGMFVLVVTVLSIAIVALLFFNAAYRE
jgi:hypothetical protein